MSPRQSPPIPIPQPRASRQRRLIALAIGAAVALVPLQAAFAQASGTAAVARTAAARPSGAVTPAKRSPTTHSPEKFVVIFDPLRLEGATNRGLHVTWGTKKVVFDDLLVLKKSFRMRLIRSRSDLALR